jgi:hypothetical protein
MDIKKLFSDAPEYPGFETDITVLPERSFSIIMDLFQERTDFNKRFENLGSNRLVISGVSHEAYNCISASDSDKLRSLLNCSRSDWANIAKTSESSKNNFSKLAFKASVEPDKLIIE